MTLNDGVMVRYSWIRPGRKSFTRHSPSINQATFLSYKHKTSKSQDSFKKRAWPIIEEKLLVLGEVKGAVRQAGVVHV